MVRYYIYSKILINIHIHTVSLYWKLNCNLTYEVSFKHEIGFIISRARYFDESNMYLYLLTDCTNGMWKLCFSYKSRLNVLTNIAIRYVFSWNLHSINSLFSFKWKFVRTYEWMVNVAKISTNYTMSSSAKKRTNRPSHESAFLQCSIFHSVKFRGFVLIGTVSKRAMFPGNFPIDFSAKKSCRWKLSPVRLRIEQIRSDTCHLFPWILFSA